MLSVLPKAEVFLIKNYVPKNTADLLYQCIKDHCDWSFMKYINNPRVPETETNTYFTAHIVNNNWANMEIKKYMQQVSKQFEIPLNTYALNYYPDSNYGLFYHGDDDCIGDTVMTTLSLGGTRRLWFLDLETKEEIPILVESGDLVVMGKDSQFKYWHGLKPEPDLEGGRIAIPFRTLMCHKGE